jgi:hypothetical protein
MVELARDRVEPDYRPDPLESPQLRADAYLAAVADWGSPADSVDEVLRRPEPARQGADAVSVAVLRPRVAPAARAADPAPAPAAESTESGTATLRGGCRAFTPNPGAEGALVVALPATGLTIAAATAPVGVRLRRFADGYRGEPDVNVPPGEPVTLTIDRDRSDRPWHVRLSASAPFRVCSPG